MRSVVASVLSCLILLCPSGQCRVCSAEKEPKQTSVTVMVDPRVELMSIIFRLAGNPEYNQGRVASYTKDVESHFGPFRKHRAVELARELCRKQGVSFDACMSMAVHLTDAYDLAEKVPFSPRPESLDGRWKPDEARAFLKAARKFVAEADFKSFLEEHRSLYDVTESRMKALLEKEGHTDWFDRFFGAAQGTFHRGTQPGQRWKLLRPPLSNRQRQGGTVLHPRCLADRQGGNARVHPRHAQHGRPRVLPLLRQPDHRPARGGTEGGGRDDIPARCPRHAAAGVWQLGDHVLRIPGASLHLTIYPPLRRRDCGLVGNPRGEGARVPVDRGFLRPSWTSTRLIVIVIRPWNRFHLGW